MHKLAADSGTQLSVTVNAKGHGVTTTKQFWKAFTSQTIKAGLALVIV